MRTYPYQSDALLVLRVPSSGATVRARGKQAQLARLLILVGSEGVTTGEAVQPLGGGHPHIAGAKEKLQKKGLPIFKEMERVSSKAQAARYRLMIEVEVLEDWSKAR